MLFGIENQRSVIVDLFVCRKINLFAIKLATNLIENQFFIEFFDVFILETFQGMID